MRGVLVVVLVVVAVGCGHPVPPPAVVAARPPPPTPAEVTCGDAGVILRGHVEDHRSAGPAKEAAIASACLHGEWPAEVLRCVGSQLRATACLDRLTADQRAAYADKLTTWNEQFPDEALDDVGDEHADAPDDAVECSDAVHDVAGFAPAVTATGDDRTLAVSLRERAMRSLCDDGWSNDVRGCLRDAKPGGLDACRAGLQPDQQKALADKLAELDQLAARIAATRHKPASFECKKVVAVHYADPAWQGKLGALKGADRVKAIVDSRTRMIKSCTQDRWSATARACIVAGGGEPCFTSHRLAVWGFPAPGVMMKTGIAECDAYGAAVATLGTCDKIPQATRDALQQSFAQLNQGWINLPADARKTAASSCKQGEDAIRQIAGSVGCRL